MKQHPLKVERELRGWSQAKVARLVGISVRTVIRWERWQSVPYPYYRELLCNLYAKNARELGLLDEETAEVLRTPSSLTSYPKRSPILDPTMPVVSGDMDTLVGREQVLSQLKKHLWEGDDFSSLALQGLPGMGKTSLAMVLAADRKLRERFHDGILWAGLGQEPDIISHLARWGALLGVMPAAVEDVNNQACWARAIHRAIGQRCLLLVIDDAWSVKDALALQVGGSQCTHLLTTRLPAIGFAFARDATFSIGELKDSAGLALLAQFVPQLPEQEPSIALELVRAVGGSPLALMLMGHYLASQAFTGRNRRMQAALERLRDTAQRLRVSIPLPLEERFPSLPAGIPLSLYTAIALSEQRLSRSARAALNALALFPPKPNSFSEEAALAVSAASVETLDELWDAGLLESNGSARYTLHQTIVDYARIQPADPVAQQRFVAYYEWLIQAHGQNPEMLDKEQRNYLAALEIKRGGYSDSHSRFSLESEY